MVSTESFDEIKINVAATCTGTFALGPGFRSVLWVQGCPFRCRGCIAPDWIPNRPNLLYDIEDLADVLLFDRRVTGVTISGGEPMAQAQGIFKLVNLLRSKREIDILVYTGYTYPTLISHPPNSYVGLLLDSIDGLIDGPYIDHLNDNHGIRGSSNQMFYKLSDRFKDFDPNRSIRTVEAKVHDGQIMIVGVPDKTTLYSFERFSSNIGVLEKR
jgi:anaerobic ribonucleoside-triphosphate reductase activating protein